MVKRSVIYTVNNMDMEIDVDKQSFNSTAYSDEDVARFFKGHFRNEDDFLKSFLNKVASPDVAKVFDMKPFVERFGQLYKEAKPYTYTEAFKIKDASFRSLVFGSINVTEMIKNLGSKRIKTDGIETTQKMFNKLGEFMGETKITNVYEVYEVSGKKLGINDNLYALKCWCTSTNNEHWLWIESKFKDNPLEAVASTFRIHSDLIDKIKEIKRQGDLLLVEMKEEYKDYEPTGEIVPLTSKQYFGLLTTQA